MSHWEKTLAAENLLDKSTRSRGWTLTIFQNEHPDFSSLNLDYSIAGREICPTTKNLHQQCYIHSQNKISFNQLKEAFPKSHLEQTKGTPEQNFTYCSKDGDYVETGKLPRQGKRSDLIDFYFDIKEGLDDVELGEEHPATYLHYYKAADRVRLNYARKNTGFSPVEVIVLYGKAGQGKTRRAFELDPNLYMLDYSHQQIWFDGLTTQKTVLIDDFSGEIPYTFLLRLLDGYKFQLPIKGGFTWKQYERVIITTNDCPESWYARGKTEALSRRITRVEKFL